MEVCNTSPPIPGQIKTAAFGPWRSRVNRKTLLSKASELVNNNLSLAEAMVRFIDAEDYSRQLFKLLKQASDSKSDGLLL
jgi:hypothetical protein